MSIKSTDYFEKNKDKIYEIAKFIANKNNEDLDTVFKNIKNEFYNRIGTNNDESIYVNDIEISLTDFLDEIRFLDHEEMLVIYFAGSEHGIVCKWIGNQFSSCVNLEELSQRLLLLKRKTIFSRQITLFFVHNHPYLYRAAPSGADLLVFGKISSVIKALNTIDMFCKIVIADFSIVTSFDYWSFIQNNLD